MAVISLKSLPLGYRFRPTDEELIDYYLRKKINGNEEDVRVIREVDVCKWEPFELPELSVIETNDKEWFFFCPRDQKYPNGLRLNRATAKGYWKATGKDRKIKSRKFVIGMKKTLVFYRGRAPKGKRTNWVMHEYRTTLEELDGTHPGQGAYVLCRLFEKHDEKIEVSQCDEVEPDVSSPTTPKSSFEDMQSELAQGTPVSGRQTEKQPANSESCQDEDFYRATPDTLVPAECQSNRYNTYDADDQLAEVTATENPPLEEDMDLFCGSILEPEDCKVFSPFHSQVRAELGSCYDPVTNYFGNCHNGLQFQCGTNENDAYISEFLASVLNDSDENCCEELGSQKNLALESETPKYVTPVSQNLASVKDGGSCSESDPEVTQAQLNPELLCCEQSQAAKVSLWVGDELQMDTNPTWELQMDTTPRCYRTLNSDNNNDGNWSTSGFFQTGSPSLDALSAGFAGYQFNDLSVKESSSRTNAVRSDDNMGTGIRIRSRLPNNRPGTQNIINQGTASRRIRLQSRLEVKPLISCKMSKLSFGEEDDEAKSTVTEERNVMEKDTTGIAYATTVDKPLKIFLPESNQEVTMNMRPQLRSRSNVPKGGVEIISSVFSKTPLASHSVLSSVCILRVTVLMVLFIIFLSLCRCL